MKVLLINHFPLFGSGSGFYTVNIAKGLHELGHEVCIIMPENSKNVPQIDGIKIHPVFFKYKDEIEGQLPFNFPHFDSNPYSDVTFYDLEDVQIKMYVNAFRQAIEDEINTFKPDIIHAQHIWVLPSIAVNYNIPVVITSHGTDIMGYEATDRYDSYGNLAIEKCKKIITISQNNNEMVLKKFPQAKEKVELIKSGYDENIFFRGKYNKKHVLKKNGISKEYKYIVSYTGRITYLKGVDTLIDAASKYETKDILTILSGNGDMLEELKNKTKEMGLKNVVFLGHQSQDVLREIYNISDVSLVPSRKEGFGLVALEALACGTPVIASNIGGIPDVVTNEVGILIEPNNSDSLASNVIKILNKDIVFDRELLSKYAQNNYTQYVFLKRLEKLYKECL